MRMYSRKDVESREHFRLFKESPQLQMKNTDEKKKKKRKKKSKKESTIERRK